MLEKIYEKIKKYVKKEDIRLITSFENKYYVWADNDDDLYCISGDDVTMVLGVDYVIFPYKNYEKTLAELSETVYKRP